MCRSLEGPTHDHTVWIPKVRGDLEKRLNCYGAKLASPTGGVSNRLLGWLTAFNTLRVLMEDAA